MSVRYRRRYKAPPFDPFYTERAGEAAPDIEIETIVERLCACTCGHRWWADAGSTTRCDGGIARFHCPIKSKPFEVPAS